MTLKKSRSAGAAVFITFSGNCKKALSFYRDCFGGTLQFDHFDLELAGFAEKPVVCGALISERFTIYGSDLVHNEGRKVGNYISIFLPCEDVEDRAIIHEKLGTCSDNSIARKGDQKLVELTDAFDVKWVLAV